MDAKSNFKRLLIAIAGTSLVIAIVACSPQPGGSEIEREVASKVDGAIESIEGTEPNIESKNMNLDLKAEDTGSAQPSMQEDLISSIPVSYLFDQENSVGMSHLVRTGDGLQVGMTASGLIPGSVVNLWLIVFNNPEDCVRGPYDCGLPDHGTNREAMGDFLRVPNSGVVVGPNGTISLSGSVSVNDSSLSGWHEFSFNGKCPLDFPDCGSPVGLTDPAGAMVRVMLHSLGPAADGELLEVQMHSYIGNCQNFIGSAEGNWSSSLDEIPSVSGECASILNATHHPDDTADATSIQP